MLNAPKERWNNENLIILVIYERFALVYLLTRQITFERVICPSKEMPPISVFKPEVNDEYLSIALTIIIIKKKCLVFSFNLIGL